MFTGIVEEIGTIRKIYKEGKSLKLTIETKKILKDTKIGDSISTNGVCLTVTNISDNAFTVDIMPESTRRSNLGNFKKGDLVNLERALKANGRFDGHIVSGHIDGTGKIVTIKKDENAIWIEILVNDNILKYIVEKGSISLDGVSLTVAYINNNGFAVSIIPHTGKVTTLLKKKIGDEINIECDILAKYIEKIIGLNNKNKLDINFLKENGFY